MRLQPEPVIKTYATATRLGRQRLRHPLGWGGGSYTFKNTQGRQRCVFDQSFMNLIMKGITC